MKFIITLLFFLFPSLVLADTLTFTPPTSDYSVFFLSNLFGMVDGILTASSGLHGTGSQIMGSMFLVFNSAVLALGGIIIMYTLIVSTMNTAHEGQMLGQKWSSIWIPIRSTIGLGLLIPKASGYCLMQIFVMWIVIQGVGAADKVWDAALSYLNRGGVIIQAQSTNPAQALLNSTQNFIAQGAAQILVGQVCMLALEKQLTARRQFFLDHTQNDKGYCTSSALKPFCDTPVPDFLNTINVVDKQNENINSEGSLELRMPNIKDTASIYGELNGICGSIKWSPIASFTSKRQSDKDYFSKEFSKDEFKTAQLSRAIAIQQMYVDLSPIARLMVSNSPQIPTTIPPTVKTGKKATEWATQQFGVPKTSGGDVCANFDNDCTSWGPLVSDVGVLFTGREFQAALNDYNNVMKPTLNAIAKASTPDTDTSSRDFIKQASASGWIMAGAYFFDLVKLNSEMSKSTPDQVDTGSGLENTDVNLNHISVDNYALLKTVFGNDAKNYISPIISLIKGGLSEPMPDFKKADKGRVTLVGDGASSVYGFINNSLNVQMFPQPGVAPLQFASYLSFSVAGKPWGNVAPKDFNCNDGKSSVSIDFGWPIGSQTICFAFLGEIFYNGMLVFIANILSDFIYSTIQTALNVILWLPLQGIALVFKQGVETISKPDVNPIVALANMGVMYINFAGNLWITILLSTVVSALFPPIFALLMLAAPLIMGWLGLMVGISFVTAYYVPILPYMMFIFGAIGWLVAVIEAMVAAPLVALGITHPEGDQAFGKGEHAIMILLNIFLRPSMMIIGYVTGIALTYVSVWILNAGFDHAISYMQGGAGQIPFTVIPEAAKAADWAGLAADTSSTGSGSGTTQYTNWSGLFAFFFSILTYTSIYLILVQKSFNLISFLPDKVLRWIGGGPEEVGREAAQWGEEAKGATKEGGTKAYEGQQQIGKQAGAGAKKGVAEIKKVNEKVQAVIKSQSDDSKPNKPDSPQGS